MLEVAEVPGKQKICGYVMSQMEEKGNAKDIPHGHITSVSVLRTYRKLGLATTLMKMAERSMGEIYNSDHVILNVRESNMAAKHLYQKTLGFIVDERGIEYYNDGENSYTMKASTKREIWNHTSKAIQSKIDEEKQKKDQEANSSENNKTQKEGQSRSTGKGKKKR
eukprot:MONOS_9004.1-p1 / transcript=MONOS_9004.1 / gene=MONOS_9004 / organism=Monocercomonoides_exilis_PA203 / gene_product=N-acetyltransferase complex ARD1 subunit / transcript_product=N-acetyltransferase complex ARD1 subunit / location=Mono_scaffold00357:1695-2381(-) / protein_length=165 / sequence_SO=supercontig / SO=protein_coding / is_pseudo=false